MSNHGWLKGEYKLPTKDWTWFKRNIIAEMKYISENKFNKAINIWNKIKNEKIKPKEIEAWVKDYLENNEESFYWRELIKNSLLKKLTFADYQKFNRSYNLKKPVKKDFPVYNSSSTSFIDDDLLVVLDNKTKTVKFISDDNNHSQDNCLDSFLGKIFMKNLNRVNWTSKTGGYLRYYDEHCRDNGLEARPMYILGKYKKKKYSPLR